jgi:sialic acid synthase SpsE
MSATIALSKPTHPAAIRIGPQRVGIGQRAFVIAEAGVNHDGNIEKAHKLIDAAKTADADAVKFQTFKAEHLVTRTARSADYQKQRFGAKTQFDMLKALELTAQQFTELKAHCERTGILFLSTPFGPKEAELLAGMNVHALKIASPDVNNPYLLEAALQTELPLIVSTGAAEIEEVDAGVEYIRRHGGINRLVLLHCVSSYPTPMADANLKAIAALAERYHVPTGYSDHTESVSTGALAVAAGAVVVEKHFTLDSTQPGPDHAMSLEPDRLADYIARIREADVAAGDGELGVAEVERDVREVARSSVVAARPIRRGEVLHSGLLTVKRPGGGIPPADLASLFGKTALLDIADDTRITQDMLD